MKRDNGRNATKTTKKNLPLVSYKLSNGPNVSIQVAVWSNIIKGERGEYELLTTTIERRYKIDDEWQSGGSFTVQEMAILTFLMSMASKFVMERKGEEFRSE